MLCVLYVILGSSLKCAAQEGRPGAGADVMGLSLLWQGQSAEAQALLSAGRTIASPSASAAHGSKNVSTY